MASRLASVTAGTRKRIERTGGVDPVSEDLLIRIAGSLEKHLWMIRAAARPRLTITRNDTLRDREEQHEDRRRL